MSTVALFSHPWLPSSWLLLYTEDKFDSPLIKQNELPSFPRALSPDIAGAVYVPVYVVLHLWLCSDERKNFLVSDNNHLFVMAALFI